MERKISDKYKLEGRFNATGTEFTNSTLRWSQTSRRTRSSAVPENINLEFLQARNEQAKTQEPRFLEAFSRLRTRASRLLQSKQNQTYPKH